MADNTANPFTTSIIDVVGVPFLIFLLSIYFLTMIVRQIVRSFIKPDKHPRTYYWWREVVLPSIPFIIGVTLAMTLTVYPLPLILTASRGMRFFTGICGGGLASSIFQIVKKIIYPYLPTEDEKKRIAASDPNLADRPISDWPPKSVSNRPPAGSK